jgi:putative membrane protein
MDAPTTQQTAMRDPSQRAVERKIPGLDDIGEEPDVRFTFANERTFLAWVRTGLALIGGGMIGAQVLRSGLGGAHLLLTVPAVALGGLIAIASYWRWEANERAMRLSEPLSYSPLTRILAIGIAGLALINVILVVIATLTR